MRSQGRLGKPLTPQTKSGYLKVPRAFFRDLHEWELIPRQFDPAHALRTPRSIGALLGPDPRVIADDIWAKLLWAGLNVEPGDLPTSDGRTYPVELIRAITLTWLFAGQRSDEIARLRVGCIRWQHGGLPIPGDSGEVLARDAVCLLDVPTHKTGTAFTKRVDPLRHRGRVGRAEGEGDRREDLGEAVAASGQGGGVCGVGAQLPVATARMVWRWEHHRGRRPAVWTPGEMLVIDWETVHNTSIGSGPRRRSVTPIACRHFCRTTDTAWASVHPAIDGQMWSAADAGTAPAGITVIT
ncbi:hypothetical protein ACOZ38_28100 [Sphaerisporangium viridialbum]|uniref:hypothetical protein n=1 Tax=Sphaerisporangium viridialbum TaxID=46189 RepID=UPI003C74B82C